MLEILRNRRSVRQYVAQPIEAEKTEALKEALLRSPSSRNIRPWEFIMVDDRHLLTRLSQCKPHGAAFLGKAPLGIIICGDASQSDVWIEDCSIAAIIVQLTAETLGLGSCWIQVRNRWHDSSLTAEAYVRELLNLPERLNVLAIMSMGYPAEKKEGIAVSELKTEKIKSNRYE